MKKILYYLENNYTFNEIVLKIIFFGIICMMPVLLKEVFNNIHNWRFDHVFNQIFIEKNKVIMSSDYEHIEMSDTQNFIKRAERGIAWWYGIGGFYHSFFELLQYLFSIIVAFVIVFNIRMWIIMIVILLAVLRYFISNFHHKVEREKYWDVIPYYIRKSNYLYALSKNTDIGKDIRMYNLNSVIENNMYQIDSKLILMNKKNQFRNFKLESILHIISVIEQVILYLYLIKRLVIGEISVSDFSFYVSSIFVLSSSLSNACYTLAKFRQYSNEVYDVRKLFALNENKICFEKNNIKEIQEIEFVNVFFKYPGQKDYVLKNISFKVKKGEKIALVGLNGAGKTTIIKLLSGLYKPNKGVILINGKEQSKLNKEELFTYVAPIFQEIYVYGMTLAENISFKKENEYKEIDDLLKKVELYDKVKTLKKETNTMLLSFLDEEGIDLSGGEKQKLALARMLHKNSEILIFDEPTAAMDALAEEKLYMQFNEMTDNKITIFISHRLASTRFCNNILLIDDGCIVEQGSHNELINENKKYAKLYKIQAENYLKES